MSRRSTDRAKEDELARKYGYTRKRAPLRLRHGSGTDITILLDYYDSFVCKGCGKAYGFFLPQGANPCHHHVSSICCECCAMAGNNSWCENQSTSYIMRV